MENKTRKIASFLPNRNPEVDPKSNKATKFLGGGREVCEKNSKERFLLSDSSDIYTAAPSP
jgi:hypothetical protein